MVNLLKKRLFEAVNHTYILLRFTHKKKEGVGWRVCYDSMAVGKKYKLGREIVINKDKKYP